MDVVGCLYTGVFAEGLFLIVCCLLDVLGLIAYDLSSGLGLVGFCF